MRQKRAELRNKGRLIWPIVGLVAAGSAWPSVASVEQGWAESADAGLAAARSGEVLVEVLDQTGQVITERMTPALEAWEDGHSVEISDLGAVGNVWRIVLYLDHLLASPTDFHNATLQLAERARELTRLGPVEVLLAGEGITSALPPTRDADALSQALTWLRLRESSQDRQREIRRAFLDEIGLESDLSETAQENVGGDLDSAAFTERVRMALSEESDLLQRYREQLLLWAVDHATPGPKALFVIGSGFDTQPSRFYRSVASDSPWRDAVEDWQAEEPETSLDEVGQVLAIYGWTVLSYLPDQRGDAMLVETEEEATAREEEEIADVIFQDGRLVDRTTIGVDPKKFLQRRRERREELAARPILMSAEEPFQILADSSGGELVRSQYQLADLFSRLALRRRLKLGEGPAPAVGPRSLVVRLRAGAQAAETGVVQVRHRRWLAHSTPAAVSTVRVRRILLDELDEGELVISAALQPTVDMDRSRLIVQRDAMVAPGEPTGPLRVTVAVGRATGETEIFHVERSGWGHDRDTDFEGEPTVEVPMEADPGGVVVVLVEDLETGLWGGSFASFVEAPGMPAARNGYDTLLLPAPKVIHLLAPRQGFAIGRTVFETVVSRDSVARVDFYLDGEREAVLRAMPFTTSLDLGPLPSPRRVEVVAMDEEGRELGRDYLIVNEGSGVFGVRIVKPRPDRSATPRQRLVGPIDVEVEVEPRRGEGIDRVEFYWRERLVATRFARPFRQRLVIPEDEATGFIRAVAFLEDGASSEDVVFVNSTGPSERLQVNLMELYVVVTDRNGRPVRKLPQDVFRVWEEGESQEIATFNEAGDLPLTVGMAIDSSASMFVKLPEVQFAASEFLRGLATRRDRAFVVSFGNEPQMTRGTTSDLPSVIESLDVLRPDGQTAIWKAIVYSLVQLQGVPGKKALIVYSDGADEDPDFSFRTCLKFARRVGVPVYVILSNNEIVRTQGKGLNVRGFLERLEILTDSVGGKVYFARVGQDLQQVYAEIDEELRSQYVVGYYSRDAGGREWRQVEVDVARAGYKARTIAGYFR